MAEVGLGLVGATLAVVVTVVPGWAPGLILPAGALVFLAKQSMETADRRSRNLSMTSAVGRAVAGTLSPELAFEAITARGVRDSLKLDGLAVVPIGSVPGLRRVRRQRRRSAHCCARRWGASIAERPDAHRRARRRQEPGAPAAARLA